MNSFFSELNTAFYGNYWHCHPDQFPAETSFLIKNNDDNTMTVKDVRAQDQHHVRDLQDKGHTLEIIWEKDWQALVTQCPDI